ncbi:hypothetical protein HNQ36_002756 [Afipia massiliensis]|uniref:EF-hand domain-containing protein n=2 Tax=Afipia massiliensis TaxID=211460 RepID=A0A840N1G5_9BRAD|nr:hypothetical protein [Afipia massiliensis]
MFAFSFATAAHAAETLSAKAYDRDGDGVLNAAETLIWRLHAQDAVLARYDTNFNGKIDAAEAEAMRTESTASFGDRSRSVKTDVLFFSNRKVAEIDKVAATRPPPPPPEIESKPSPKDCDLQQRLFIRRDRLDTYQFRDGSFMTGTVPRDKAKGASVSFTHDDIARSDSATINGRVSYVLVQNDPMNPCFAGLPKDPYAVPDFRTPSLFGSTVAVWVDGQGTISSPQAKSERSALKSGLDAQVGVIGGPLFDYQFLIASPYAQTDFRGEARAYGFTAAWEPIASDARLGGSLKAPPSPYLNWFWQVRAEVDLKHVDQVGSTALSRGDYIWGGGTARLHLIPFPDLSVYDAFGVAPFPSLVNRFYADLTLQYHREFDRGIDALQWAAEVGFNITADGGSSISVRYTDGTDKDTLVKARQYLIALNYKL